MTTTSAADQSGPARDLFLAEVGVDTGLSVNILPQDPVIENVQAQNDTFQENEIPRLETGYTQGMQNWIVHISTYLRDLKSKKSVDNGQFVARQLF